jgi:5-hydroxyisourate hydrolase-like protein (transthyretin family)
MKYNNFDHNRLRPYKAQNMIVKTLETNAPPQTQPSEETPQPLSSSGYINVGVYTALGALPVKDAVVTVYTIDQDGEENALYHVVTNINGRVPTMEVPVEYNPDNPLESPSFYFSTYNMRVQAIGYYTVNIIDLRVFPDVATNYKVSLIPVMEGATEEGGSQTVVIPPTPADISNE